MSKESLLHVNTAFNASQLSELQQAPLEQKIALTERRLHQFYEAREGAVFVSFSGGKDSTVLLHIARRMYPDIPAMYLDTGLEYPEIRAFVATFAGVDWVKPSMRFDEVLTRYGIPLPSKEIAEAVYEYRTTRSEKLRAIRDKKLSGKWAFLKTAPFMVSDKCCDIMKKNPSKKYERETGRAPIIGSMASESRLRASSYKRYGCNIYDGPRPRSNPMMFWTDSDVWEYLHKYNVSYSSIYDKGYTRTGCAFCLFGALNSDDTRLARLQETHPAIYSYCMGRLNYKSVLAYCYDSLKAGKK